MNHYNLVFKDIYFTANGDLFEMTGKLGHARCVCQEDIYRRILVEWLFLMMRITEGRRFDAV